ncbi:ParB/RepB/Spo0J family partition protein [Streptococcus dentapri]|uniref:ParB/RepB/Spo0J family partition protein n=1 Tax=Streptococcus dentapri TaxID=573564 RepID=A0ABV8D2Q8_9STRE
MAEELKQIRLKDISPNPFQPRLTFKEEELEELAKSIKENGLIQPIIVRKSQVFGYELIAGERRFRASQLANLKTIPAIVKDLSDKDSRIQAIIENLQRSDLNPIEEAQAYQKLIETSQMTHEEIAQYMGKSRPYITNFLRLLNLSENIQAALEDGSLSSGHARLLLGLSETEQENWLATIKDQKLSVRELEKLLSPKNKPQTTKKTKDIFKKNLEQELTQFLGTPVSISMAKNQTGKLSIHFSSQEDLNRIVNKLK